MLAPSTHWSRQMAQNAKGSSPCRSLSLPGRWRQHGIVAWTAPQRRRNEKRSVSTSTDLEKRCPASSRSSYPARHIRNLGRLLASLKASAVHKRQCLLETLEVCFASVHEQQAVVFLLHNCNRQKIPKQCQLAQRLTQVHMPPLEPAHKFGMWRLSRSQNRSQKGRETPAEQSQ